MTSLRHTLRLGARAHQPLGRAPPTACTLPLAQRRYRSLIDIPRRPAEEKPAEEAEQASEDLEDVNMNGHYPDPSLTSALPLKRSLRDPYGNWWDPQERRNYGEPVHEDNDILGIFSTEEYRHFTPAWGAVLWGTLVASILGLSAVCWRFYPDKPSATRTFPGGLEAELGGPRAPRAAMEEDDLAAKVEGGSRSSPEPNTTIV